MKNLQRLFLATASSLIAALLTACGGGGDGGSPQPPGTFNAQAGITALFSQGGTFALTGSGGGYLWRGTETFTTGAPQEPSLSGYPATARAQARRIEGAETSSAPDRSTYYYGTAPFVLAGYINNSFLRTYASQGSLPATGAIGQSGVLARFNDTMGGGSETVRWKIEAAEAPDTAYACLEFITVRGNYNALCARIDPQGRVLGLRTVDQIGNVGGFVIEMRS